MTDQIPDPELEAMQHLLRSLGPLDTDGRFRVLSYVFSRLGIEWSNVPVETKRIAAPVETFKSLPAPEIPPVYPPADPTPATPPAAMPSDEAEPERLAMRDKPVDVRTFSRSKNPTKNVERAAVVAYYLAHLAPEGERKDAIKAADIEKYFALVPYEVTSSARQILYDSKNAGYLELGSRGSYRLNTIGFNMVESLPRDKA
jgi:hypothetical protein